MFKVTRRRVEEDELRRLEQEEHFRRINDPKDWPELSPSPVKTRKRVDKTKTDNSIPVIENGEVLTAWKSPSPLSKQHPSNKVTTKELPTPAIMALVDDTNSNTDTDDTLIHTVKKVQVDATSSNTDTDDTLVHVENKVQGPPENNKSSEPTKEEMPVPRRQQRLTSRCRRTSPPPQQLVADYEAHWERTSSLYDADKERYQYIAQAMLDLESNRAKIRDEYDLPQYEKTPFTDLPSPNIPPPSNPFYTPAATPERQTTTPETYFQDQPRNTDANNLADLLAQYSLKDLMANQELAVSADIGAGGQYTPPESPEVQDDRDSYNRQYGHLFYRDGVPYKFFDAVHPDKKRNRFGALWTQYGNRNGALNGFVECPLEHTTRMKLTKEMGDEPTRYWTDLAKRRRGKGNVRHAWGDYDPKAPSGNRPESDSPAPDDGYHHLLGLDEF